MPDFENPGIINPEKPKPSLENRKNPELIKGAFAKIDKYARRLNELV